MIEITAISVFLLSACGWSALFQRRSQDRQLIFERIVLGIVILVTISGLANSVSLLTKDVVILLLAIGAVASVSFLIFSLRAQRLVLSTDQRASLALFVLTLLALVFAQPKQTVFNFHDDFHKYFVYPIKLLETGSVFGSPYASVGSQFLGAQSVLQAIFIAMTDVLGITTIEHIIFPALIVLFLFEAAQKSQKKALFFAAGILCISITPVEVNVSAFFSSVALLIYAALLIGRVLHSGSNELPGARDALPLGLTLAAIIALKMTNLIFVLILLASVLTALICYKRTREFSKFIVLTIALSSVALAPWVFWPITELLMNTRGITELVPSTQIQKEGLFSIERLAQLTTLEKSFLGIRPLFHVLVLLVLGLVAVLDVIGKKIRGRDACRLALVASIALLSLAYVVLLTSGVADLDTTFRYLMPFEIAIVTLLMVNSLQVKGVFYNYQSALFIIFPIFFLGFEASYQRVEQLYRCGSMLAFSEAACEEEYIQYSRYVLSPEHENFIRGIQGLVPPEEQIFAYIDTPFLLNFSRNQILEVDVAGLINPWAGEYPGGYYLFQYRGYGSRSLPFLEALAQAGPGYDRNWALKAAQLFEEMERMVNSSAADVLYHDNGIVLFKSSESLKL